MRALSRFAAYLERETAYLEHETATRFLLETALGRARRILKASSTVTLEIKAFDRFYAVLDDPAEVVPEAVRLFGKAAISKGSVQS